MDGRATSTPGTADGGILRFGVFELDPRTGELRRSGALVKLQQQPFKVLALLVGRPGELVTREELRREIWGGDTYVDFDQGLNFCIKQIRTALGDQADTPRYVETLPRRGYRFIAPVEAAPAAEPAPVKPTPTPLPFPAPDRRRRVDDRPPRRRRWLWAAGPVAGVTLAAAGFAVGRASTPVASPAFTRLTFSRGVVLSARFAGDGQVLYSAAWNGREPELFATRQGAADTRALGVSAARIVGLAGTELAVRRTVDGRRWTLSTVPVAGGPPRDIADEVAAADWSRDGAVFAAVRNAGGRPRLEFPLGTVLAGAVTARLSYLRLSPRADRVAFFEHPMPNDDRGSVVTVDRRGRRQVLSSGWASLEGLAWAPEGDEVWFTGTRLGADSALNAVRLDGRERLVYRGPGRLVLHDVGPAGRALLSRSVVRMEVRGRAPGSAQEQDLSWLDLPYLAGLSADGRSVVFGESGEAGGPGYSIFLRRDAAQPVRLGEGRPLAFSPDGQWVASLPVAPPFNVVLIPTGAGAARTLTQKGGQDIEEAGWSADGRHLVLAAREPGRPPRLFAQPVDGGPARPITPEGVSARHVVVSPDGQWVVGYAREGAPALHPFAGGDPRPVAGADKDDLPLQWSADGRALYVGRGRLPLRIERLDLATGRRQPWRELAPDDRAGVFSVARVELTRDGQAYAFGYPRALSELYAVDGLR